jgi:hypothetical protein
MSEATPGPVSAGLRLGAAAGLVALFIIGQVCRVTGVPLVAAIGISLFLQVGPGLVFALLLRRLPSNLFALCCLIGGPTLVCIVATTTALTGAASLGVVWKVLAGLTLVGLGFGAAVAARHVSSGSLPPVASELDGRYGGSDAAPWSTERRQRWHSVGAGMLAALGLVLALLAAAAQRGDPRPAGAAVTASPIWLVGALLVLAAVVYAWRTGASLAVPVVTLSTVVVASQGVMYQEPTAAVAARHIGLVNYVLVHGQLDRSTDIYQAWAGLFAAAALNAQAAHLQDLFAYATWWGVIAAPLMVVIVRSVARRFLDQRRSWLAALVFGLGSSLNTSFFAPQVFGFLMAFAVVALLVLRTEGGEPESALITRVVAAGVISVALALTHQISPYLLAVALLALAVFRLVRPWWAFLLPTVPAVAWAILNRHLLTGYISVDAFGRLFDNLAPPEHDLVTFPIPLINRITFLVPAAALVCIGLLALLALARRPTRVSWGLAAAAASPVALMAGTSYGQEGIFRVALFALPWLAILACVPPARVRLQPALQTSSRILLPAALTILFAVNVLGLTGMDWARVIRTGDVSAAEWVERSAPEGSVVLSLGTDLTLPTGSTARYADVGWISRSTLIPPPGESYPTTTGPQYDATADLRHLTRRFARTSATEHYAVAADSAGGYDQRYGYQRYSDHQKLSDAIAESDRWKPVYRTQGITVYQLQEPAR